jgi:hypothetical protein
LSTAKASFSGSAKPRTSRHATWSTVVERHVVPGVPEEGYSVELFDMTGNTVAVITLPASALRIPTPADRPAVRALSA